MVYCSKPEKEGYISDNIDSFSYDAVWPASSMWIQAGDTNHSAGADTKKLSVNGIVPVVKQVINMPDADTMEKLMASLENL